MSTSIPTHSEPQPETRDPEALRRWLCERVAHHVNLPAEDVKPDVPLTDYGLNSIYALTVAAEIEDHLDIALEETVMWDYPSIDDLVSFLTQ